MAANQKIEFYCPKKNCPGVLSFFLKDISDSSPPTCPECGKSYPLPRAAVDKLKILDDLQAAVRKARPILGDTSVGVEVGNERVRIPYYLLLTRMSTELALNFAGEGIDFHFVINPLEEEGVDE